MLPTTIDGVIARLDAIVDDCERRGDRLGYFAALYGRVTRAVRDGIAAGRFQDGPRMERLDVTFACRYLDAYDTHARGGRPTHAWAQAFAAAADDDHIVLQHLMIGMNAHIDLDLGIAAARTCPGAALAGLRGDFDRINDILAALTPIVEHEIDEESPGFRVLTSCAPALELKLAGVGMRGARDLAWRLATELAPLGPEQQEWVIGVRDLEAVALGEAVLCPGPLVYAIRSCESRDVRHNIRVLAQGEQTHPRMPAHAANDPAFQPFAAPSLA
jgi:hypothetical protein